MGNTIRNEMKTDRLREENQNSANITKDATGVVFITDTSGAISSRNLVYLAAPTAANIPSRAANPKPPKILHAEKAMLAARLAMACLSGVACLPGLLRPALLPESTAVRRRLWGRGIF